MIYAAVALAVALLCLLAGFLWGRSNVRAQVEDAVEKEHVALDAREFKMRQQLEEAIAEIARLRPLAEELGQVQKRLEREQTKYGRMKAEFNAAVRVGQNEESGEQENAYTPEPAQPVESADQAIQKLLQSLEVFNEPNGPTSDLVDKTESIEPAVPHVPQPTPVAPPTQVAPAPQTTAFPPAPALPPTPALRPASALPPAKETRQAPEIRQPANAVAAEPSKAEPARPLSTEPRKPQTQAGKPSQPVDEWLEFARELDALTGRKK